MNDAAVSLPLLEGLYRRPGAPSTIAKHALRRYKAGLQISRWISAHLQRQKKCKQQKQLEASQTTRTTMTESNRVIKRKSKKEETNNRTLNSLSPFPSSSVASWEHWIFRSLVSSSLLVRQASCRILLHGTPLNQRSVLRDVIMTLVQSHVFGGGSRSSEGGGGGESSIQLVGLLSHFLVQHTTDLQSFCANGGLRWTTKHILGLVIQLFPCYNQDKITATNATVNDQPLMSHVGTATSSSSSSSLLPFWSGMDGTVEQQEEPSLEEQLSLQKRLVLLVDLCYHLVLFASMPYHSSNNTAKSVSCTKKKKNEESTKGNTTTTAENPSSSSTGTTVSSTTTTTINRKRSRSSSNASVSSSQPKEDDKRRHNAEVSKRLVLLRRVHGLLWSSQIPSVYLNPSPSMQQQPQQQSVQEDGMHQEEEDENGMVSPTATTATTKEIGLSPLACLVYVYEALKDSHPLAAKIRGMDSCLAMLSKLVDPTAQATVSTASIPQDKYNKSGSNNSMKRKKKQSSSSSPLSSSNRQNAKKRQGQSSTNNNNQTTTKRKRRNQASQGAGGAAISSNRRRRRKKPRTTSGMVSSFLFPGGEVLGGSDPSSSGAGAGGGQPTSAAAAMARAVSAAMEAMEEHGGSTNLDDAHHHRLQFHHDDDDDDEDDDEDEEDNDGEEEEEGGVNVFDMATDADEDEEHDDDEEEDEDEDNEEIDEEEAEGQHHEDIEDEDEEIEEEEVDDEATEEPMEEEEVVECEEGDEEDEDIEEDEDEEEDEHDIVIDEVAGVDMLDIHNNEVSSSRQRSSSTGTAATQSGTATTISSTTPVCPSLPTENDRKQAYICAGMQVLAAQYPHIHSSSSSYGGGSNNTGTVQANVQQQDHHNNNQQQHSSCSLLPPMSHSAEQSLLKSICNVVKPPKKPLNLKVFMKRAPTQEEFFRGSLSRNPIPLTLLNNASSSSSNAAASASTSGGGSGGGGDSSTSEPTVRDLRQYIANDLQMSDSAELLELLVANKILDMNLKLRVVQQVLWKNHLVEHSTSSFASSILSGQSGHSLFASGSGLSMVFSSGGGGSGSSAASRNITSDTPVTALPPMVVTYRLAGVDGEATEDHVDEGSLADPEAPSEMQSAEAREKLMEKEYGITRFITEGRGIFVLLRSIESNILDTLRRIRRDNVSLRFKKKAAAAAGNEISSSSLTLRNPSQVNFLTSPPCSGLILLRHCANLAHNRKKLLEARAPTVLLRLLLDVLNSLEENNGETSGGTKSSGSENSTNPTANVLKELIEALASDISSDSDGTMTKSARTFASQESFESDAEQESGTLPLLLSSLRTTFLSPPLRKVIAKLLPYLTYGQVTLSRELALDIHKHIIVDDLKDGEDSDESSSSSSPSGSSVLMDTFVQAAINLPPCEVCNTLRMELINCGFVDRIAMFALKHIPSQPPPWSPALWSKDQALEKSKNSTKHQELADAWRVYFARSGVRTAYRMLTGLVMGHGPTQSMLANVGGSDSSDGDNSKNGCPIQFLTACHWIESTSDNSTFKINLNGIGILAETLLDELKEDNAAVAKQIGTIRRKTRARKKEIAEERRSKALVSMSAFGTLAGARKLEETQTRTDTSASSDTAVASSGGVRDVAASMLAPVFGLFGAQSSAAAAAATNASASSRSIETDQAKRNEKQQGEAQSTSEKPSWKADMEAMEDETGLTCSVCQEGRTLQPTELLGLYAYIKKVSIPHNHCGGRTQVDGTRMLLSLPSNLPDSLLGTDLDEEYFSFAKEAANALRNSSYAAASLASIAQSRRPSHFVTTVTAGNAIHCSCHATARTADRNHPKAPKSEWEGASLRNSRVACNAIMPLVSSRSSKVPLMAVEIALTDYQTIISNMLGARPKSMLWSVLHDMRLLLLRMDYGEALNTDCAGGSLSSNAMLLFHEMFMADMFARDAEHDSPETAKHARSLSGGLVAAYEILEAEDFDRAGSSAAASMLRGLSDAAPMAALCCILFHNEKDDSNADSGNPASSSSPSPQRRWVLQKEKFLCALIICAGRRHALGVEDSGCMTPRGGAKARVRSSSFSEWDMVEDGNDAPENSVSGTGSSPTKRNPPSILGKRGLPQIDEYASALRPMITLYAILDQLSAGFVVEMADEKIEDSVSQLVKTVEACQRCKTIHELLQKANIGLDQERIVEELQKGLMLSD